MNNKLEESVAAHICRSIFASSILAEQFPLPGVDSLLVHHISIVYNMLEAPITHHLRVAWNLKDSNLIEAEIVQYANNLDTFLLLHERRFGGNTAIITKYNELYSFFQQNRDKITLYYPYMDRILGGVVNDWNSEFLGQDLQNSSLEERKAFGLHIV